MQRTCPIFGGAGGSSGAFGGRVVFGGGSSCALAGRVVVVVVVDVVALVQGTGFGGIVGVIAEMPFGQEKPSFHSNLADFPASLKAHVFFSMLMEAMSN